MLLKIIKDLILDLMAASGIVISINPMDYVDGTFRSLAGLGGLIMLYYSIQYKILLIKKEKRELEIKKQEQEDGTEEKPAVTDN